MSRLKDLYNNEIVDAMTKKFGYANVMEVPKLDKIVINMGVVKQKKTLRSLRMQLLIWKLSPDRRQF